MSDVGYHSDVLGVVAGHVAPAIRVPDGAFIPTSAALLPHRLNSSGEGRLEEALVVEPVELLQVFSPSEVLEGLQHDQVVPVLESGVLDVLH